MKAAEIKIGESYVGSSARGSFHFTVAEIHGGTITGWRRPIWAALAEEGGVTPDWDGTPCLTTTSSASLRDPWADYSARHHAEVAEAEAESLANHETNVALEGLEKPLVAALKRAIGVGPIGVRHAGSVYCRGGANFDQLRPSFDPRTSKVRLQPLVVELTIDAPEQARRLLAALGEEPQS